MIFFSIKNKEPLVFRRCTGYVTTMKYRNDFKILTGKPTGKLPLRKPMRGLKDNFGIDLKEIDLNTKNWVDSVHERGYWRTALVIAALNLRIS
jgi:hypothetical protein